MGFERVVDTGGRNTVGGDVDAGFEPVYEAGNDPDNDSMASDDTGDDSTYEEPGVADEDESKNSDDDGDEEKDKDHRSGEGEHFDDPRDTLSYGDEAPKPTTEATSGGPPDIRDTEPFDDPTGSPCDDSTSIDEYDKKRMMARRWGPYETIMVGGWQ